MRTLLNIVILFILIGIFISCNKPMNKKESMYNGVNEQILHIVDSMNISLDDPFATIWFSLCDDSNYVVRFFNGMLIPSLPLPSDTIKEILVSENNDFFGYKKYNDIYLIFLEYNSKKQLNKFVEKDSLKFDEGPFEQYRIYDFNKKATKIVEKKYFINKNDNLIFFEGKCLFDVD